MHRADKWQGEMELLRTIALDSGLSEEMKWGKPCYTHDGSNIVIIQPFKDACGFMFFKGALLEDAKGVLERPGENSRAARRAMVTSVEQVKELEPVLKAYIAEAVAAEEAGLEVDTSEEQDVEYPEEFLELLEDDPELQAAFDELTPGRQRAYVMYFAAAKQSSTRTARVERYRQQILDGKGMNDR
jgi:uncharacterized protein YdeI (YjbR/CyaY-like superfamily)